MTRDYGWTGTRLEVVLKFSIHANTFPLSKSLSRCRRHWAEPLLVLRKLDQDLEKREANVPCCNTLESS